MPLIEVDDYRPPFLYRQTHLATSLPTLFRKVEPVPMKRWRIDTADNDFIDLDCWWQDGSAKNEAEVPTIVLCHGLEGNAQRQYMQGMARIFGRNGWNVVGFNYRGCSGEPNRQPQSYHSGATADLRLVLAEIQKKGHLVRALVGFSLGGNLTLKYLGEDPGAVLPTLKAAAVFSVPIDLAAGSRQLMRRENALYQLRFNRKLAVKIKQKAAMFPDKVDAGLLDKVKNLWDFDDLYTGPMNGFIDAEDYYEQCSSIKFLSSIQLPTLLVNALNDPFLPEECYPHQTAAKSEFLHLQTPAHGGHVGFYLPGETYWSEEQAWRFIRSKTTG